MHAYIAGSMFSKGEQWWLGQVDQCVRKAGLTTFLPLRDGSKLEKPEDVELIFQEDVREVTRADVVVASLDGPDVEAGTAWEVGLAYARGKYVVGIDTDWRHPHKFQVINVMVQNSLDHLARSLEELESHLKEHVRRTRDGATARKKRIKAGR